MPCLDGCPERTHVYALRSADSVSLALSLFLFSLCLPFPEVHRKTQLDAGSFLLTVKSCYYYSLGRTPGAGERLFLPRSVRSHKWYCWCRIWLCRHVIDNQAPVEMCIYLTYIITPILRLSPEALRHKLLSDIEPFFVAPVVQQGKNPAVNPPKPPLPAFSVRAVILSSWGYTKNSYNSPPRIYDTVHRPESLDTLLILILFYSTRYADKLSISSSSRFSSVKRPPPPKKKKRKKEFTHLTPYLSIFRQTASSTARFRFAFQHHWNIKNHFTLIHHVPKLTRNIKAYKCSHARCSVFQGRPQQPLVLHARGRKQHVRPSPKSGCNRPNGPLPGRGTSHLVPCVPFPPLRRPRTRHYPILPLRPAGAGLISQAQSPKPNIHPASPRSPSRP